MKIQTLRVLAGVSASLILSGSASAGLIGLTVEQLPIGYARGILTYRIYAQFDGTQGQSGDDFLFAVGATPVQAIHVAVRGGAYFQHIANTHAGGDLPPDPALCVDDPTVCLDTFVTIGKETSIGDATQLHPAWPGFGRDSLGPCAPCSWSITPDDEQGLPDKNDRVLLAQLSTQDGVGFFGEFLVTGFSNGQASQVSVFFDTGCYVDIDGDNIVGICDFLLVLAEWGPCQPECFADVDGDGEVGILDFLLVLVNWGPCESLP